MQQISCVMTTIHVLLMNVMPQTEHVPTETVPYHSVKRTCVPTLQIVQPVLTCVSPVNVLEQKANVMLVLELLEVLQMPPLTAFVLTL